MLPDSSSVLISELRAWHAGAVYRQQRDPAIARSAWLPYLSGEAEAGKWIERCRATPNLRSFAILTAEDGVVGVCRLRIIRNTGLFSIWIGSDYHARGLGTAALRELLGGAVALGARTVAGAALIRNVRSQRMMERCGMQRVLPDRILDGNAFRLYMHPAAHSIDIEAFCDLRVGATC